MNLPQPTLDYVCDFTVELDTIREMGAGRAGNRRIIPIIGGTVDGPKIKGKILNLGADWQTIFASGLAELDTRYAIETDDGATIEIINYGLRPKMYQPIVITCVLTHDWNPVTHAMTGLIKRCFLASVHATNSQFKFASMPFARKAS